MPRQPFPTHLYLSDWSIGPESLGLRARHATAIGLCLSHWPEVEYQMALMLALLLRADTPAAVAVYGTLRRSSGRNEALQAAARNVLNTKNHNLFKSILRVLGIVEKERNFLAHSLWGFCDALPNSILAISQEDNAAFAIEQFNNKNTATGRFSPQVTANLATKIAHYRKKDLEDILKSIGAAISLSHNFNRHILLGRDEYADESYNEIRDQVAQTISSNDLMVHSIS